MLNGYIQQVENNPDNAQQIAHKKIDSDNTLHLINMKNENKQINGQLSSSVLNQKSSSSAIKQPNTLNTNNQVQAPLQTFENSSFLDLMTSYEGVQHGLQPTIELTQALLMSNNFKESAGIINGLQICAQPNLDSQIIGDKVSSLPQVVDTGASYFYKQDYIADLTKKCNSKDFTQISQLLTNIGASDKASNWLLEQKNLQRAQTNENRDIRDLIKNQIVDPLEYIRINENITQAKIRSKKFLDGDATIDSEIQFKNADNKILNQNEVINGKYIDKTKKLSPFSSETQEDSGQALKNKQLSNDRRINGIIKQIRSNAQQYLGSKDGRNYDKIPLTTICRKLRQDNSFIKRRDLKLFSKTNNDFENLKIQKNQLYQELDNLNQNNEKKFEKQEILNKIQTIEQVLGLEKRLKRDCMDISVAEIDVQPMNSKAFDIQNILFDYCGINLSNQYADDSSFEGFSNQKRIEKLFGKIRKLPKKSCILSSFENINIDSVQKKQNQLNENSQNNNQELVKVIGLEPNKLFEKIQKYKIQIDRMPKFSNNFDTVESVMPWMQNKISIPGISIMNPATSQMQFQRIDGRQVISLQFNPYFLDNDIEKKKIYDGYMQDILEQREKIKNAPKEAKNKQEAQNIKRAWQNIVKKDIPKAYRMYQKFKADQENNNKKLSQNCLKEVRKRAVKTQRLAKESVMRARKLTKEMCNYWRKRDKEMADSKRKREKLDKELKKKLQEEEEALLQKKRLEYLMQQSEIYAHFMATKLGVSDELQKSKQEIDFDKSAKKLDVDKRAARIHIAGMINENRKRLDEFDDHDRDEVNEDDLDEQKFKNPLSLNKSVEKPSIFKGDLKAYQLKGLQWLDNLYDQGINGILADEMGLGKTIQTIALLAHLAEKKNVWGPFLIIVPVTTLHNWQNELAKFCPDLKVLPYFGSAEERKKLAKFLDPKNLYNPAMCIHVLITSYNLIVGGGKDQLRLQKVKWHYMILDEAQAIKNNASRRWKTLLNFQTRNRLLLSGTPIQNSMAELWALLHFIMPKLFDNHEQFQEWFSKDIEQHSMDQGELNKHQLKRLHLILQPFMLRRLKKDVEQEIAPKVEEIIQCDMTHRQKVLYDRIKRKICAQDLFQLASSKAKVENLMNLVMQFRKVCNHPDLFERRIGRIPFVFSKMQHGMQQNMSLISKPDVIITTQNPIQFELPKMIYDECFFISDNNTKLFTKQKKYLDVSFSTVSVDTHFNLFNIFNEKNLYDQIYSNKKTNWNSAYSILGLLMHSNNWGVQDISYQAVADQLILSIILQNYYYRKNIVKTYMNIHNSDLNTVNYNFKQFGMFYEDNSCLKYNHNPKKIDIIIRNFNYQDDSLFLFKNKVKDSINPQNQIKFEILTALVPKDPLEFLGYSIKLKNQMNIFFSKCITESIKLECASSSFKRFIQTIFANPHVKRLMNGQDFKPKKENYIGYVGKDRELYFNQQSNANQLQNQQIANNCKETGYSLVDNGILNYIYESKGSCTLQLPDYSRLVTDCAKMGVLAELLERLHKNGNRCLIFCQMTRMMDILEDFLIWQKYSYFRMDGSTQLQDRRFMVEEFQSNPNIFIFILSTRAGGLGINLIAADTVIFYDNDWNPTMDSQATDRAHRIGQKKKVHVYRLVTKGTVEERILRRARQKENVQSTVYGANLKADQFSTRDVVDMIIDDIEDPLNQLGQNRNQVKGFIKAPAGVKTKDHDKKKKKKKQIFQNDGEIYDSVKKINVHQKYENEIDLLIGCDQIKQNQNNFDQKNIEIKDIESSGEDQNFDDSDDDQSSFTNSSMEKKKLLLQMLDKQTGGEKQTFNFEEDEIGGNLNGSLNNKMNGQANQDKKKQKGRQGQSKNGNSGLQVIEDDLDEDMEDEEVEY